MTGEQAPQPTQAPEQVPQHVFVVLGGLHSPLGQYVAGVYTTSEAAEAFIARVVDYTAGLTRDDYLIDEHVVQT